MATFGLRPILRFPRVAGFLLLLSLSPLAAPPDAHATGQSDEAAPPTLPYYLDRLPAKPPSQVFFEAAGSPVAASVNFKARALALASAAEKTGAKPAALLADAEALLVLARLDKNQPALLCNLFQDIRDLFAAASPVVGKPAANYIRWRVEHADWFGLEWETPKKAAGGGDDEREVKGSLGALQAKAHDKAAGPLRVHWLYLLGAYGYPKDSEPYFQKVVDEFPDHPRAEAARFMLARCALVASRSHSDYDEQEPKPEVAAAVAKDRARAQELFKDYLKRYPSGRFVADAPGWLGALAYDAKDYLGALGWYLQQADTPGHPEVIKSAGFMCERCLSHLSTKGDQAALQQVAEHPKLAMSLIYLLVNTSETDNTNGALETPEEVGRWRRALLPRLAAEVAAHESAYKSADWQPRYLAILAQAASGEGDQTKALALCDMAKGEIDRNDDLAFIRLTALQRARRLPEAVAAGRAFMEHFPRSPLASGAAFRMALALQDNHQAGLAVVELMRLKKARLATDNAAENDETRQSDEHLLPADDDPTQYPVADSDVGVSESVLRHDVSGAEPDQLSQMVDALLNFAPLPELAAALSYQGKGALDGAEAIRLRAELAQRWLAEEENFIEAKKYVTPAQWSIAAANLEKLTAAASAHPADPDALMHLADGWSAVRGKLLFAPLETDETRKALFADENESAGLKRRENGMALGFKPEAVNHVLESRDEWLHAFRWRLRAADAAPMGSPARARALWLALKTMPSIALVSPFTLTHAGETDAGKLSRSLCERLQRECPTSREAREFAVYYDLGPLKAPAKKPPADGESAEEEEKRDPLYGALSGIELREGEPEYAWGDEGVFGDFPPSPTLAYGQNGTSQINADSSTDSLKLSGILERMTALRTSPLLSKPEQMAKEVTSLRAVLRELYADRDEAFLLNFLDDLTDFLQEPAAKLKPAAIERYLELRTECLSVEAWGWTGPALPAVPGAGDGSVDDTVLAHIRGAYKAPELAAFKDYLDFLALAVIANHTIEVTVPGEVDTKDSDDGKPHPVMYSSRDYPKLAKLAEGFLTDYPHSHKREAARLLYARALYAASRPHVRAKFAVWPASEHFASGTILATHRREPFDPRKLGAALNAYDKEFPDGRYAREVRNLRALLAWRTQDWKISLDLTLKALQDKAAPDLQAEAATRLANIFVEGLTDETERMRCLEAIKSCPGAPERLKAYLEKCDYPLHALKSWLLAQL